MPAPGLDSASDIGAALRTIRQDRGITLQQVADLTRVRPVYLQALEDMQLEELPSLPFALGYIRAYASALGQDPDEAAIRLRRAMPEPEDQLADPVGVEKKADPRLRLAAVGVVVILLAIAAWSVMQRTASRPRSAAAGVAPGAPPAAANPGGEISLGAPTPPPAEATSPDPYVTPGLDGQPAVDGLTPKVATAPPANLGAPFEAKGQVYGDPKSSLILKAAKNGVTVVVRRADGSDLFAQVLAAGEAYGAPVDPGLTVEVNDPSAIEVYAGGVLKSTLPAASVPLSKLAPPAPPPMAAAPAGQAAAAPGVAVAPAVKPAAATPVKPPAAATTTPTADVAAPAAF